MIINSCTGFNSQHLLPFVFSLFMMFENEYLWFDYHFDYSCIHICCYIVWQIPLYSVAIYFVQRKFSGQVLWEMKCIQGTLHYVYT